MSDGEALRGSTRAGALVADKRGGARPGAGRKAGGHNKVRKGWDAWVKDIQSVTRAVFRREKLRELAEADAWRYLERIAIPLALRSQPGAPPGVGDVDQLALPLVYCDIPESAARSALGDDSQREREAEMLGAGGEVIEGDAVQVRE